MDPDTSRLVCLAAEVAILLTLALGLALASYIGLARGCRAVEESWAGVDTELRRRYDLIPNLATIVQGYATHERETLQRMVEARSRAMVSTGSPTFQALEENVLVKALREVFAVAERHPQLKADGDFLAVMKELSEVEDRIQAARREYNVNVRVYNGRCQAKPVWLVKLLFRLRFLDAPCAGVDVAEALPSGIVAWLFDFGPAEFFEIDGLWDKAVSEE